MQLANNNLKVTSIIRENNCILLQNFTYRYLYTYFFNTWSKNFVRKLYKWRSVKFGTVKLYIEEKCRKHKQFIKNELSLKFEPRATTCNNYFTQGQSKTSQSSYCGNQIADKQTYYRCVIDNLYTDTKRNITHVLSRVLFTFQSGWQPWTNRLVCLFRY